MFPIIGSVTLFSLYLIFKYIDKTYLNLILTAYFCILGVGALVSTTLTTLRTVTGKELKGSYKIQLFNKSKGLEPDLY